MYFSLSPPMHDCMWMGICIFANVCVVCVWNQGLYMDGVQLFPTHMQEFVDVMTEKELRLRLPLEELDILLEEWTWKDTVYILEYLIFTALWFSINQ